MSFHHIQVQWTPLLHYHAGPLTQVIMGNVGQVIQGLFCLVEWSAAKDAPNHPDETNKRSVLRKDAKLSPEKRDVVERPK